MSTQFQIHFNTKISASRLLDYLAYIQLNLTNKVLRDIFFPGPQHNGVENLSRL